MLGAFIPDEKPVIPPSMFSIFCGVIKKFVFSHIEYK